MANEDVINEIEDEIKKAKGEPEDFQIEITDDPVEEVKDIIEEEKTASENQEEDYGPKVQKSKMPSLVQDLLDLNKGLFKTARKLLIKDILKQRLL